MVLAVATAAVSVWEREHRRLRTLINTGALAHGELARPSEEQLSRSTASRRS